MEGSRSQASEERDPGDTCTDVMMRFLLKQSKIDLSKHYILKQVLKFEGEHLYFDLDVI